jgi:hypothetical protein
VGSCPPAWINGRTHWLAAGLVSGWMVGEEREGREQVDTTVYRERGRDDRR